MIGRPRNSSSNVRQEAHALPIALGAETTRARVVPLPTSEAAPGSNLHADLAASDWRFLLPRLRYATALYLGTPSQSVVRVLSEMAELAIIVSANNARRAQLAAELAAGGTSNVVVRAPTIVSGLPVASHTIELLVACAGEETSRLLRSLDCLGELDRILTANGVVYMETGGVVDTALMRRQAARSADYGFSAPAVMCPVRRHGALRVVLPIGDDATIRYCVDNLISGTSRRARQLRQIARALARARLLPYAVPRRLMLLERSHVSSTRTAAYVHTHARSAGLRLPDRNVVFFSRSDYNANKIMLLVSDESGTPRVVVKMTRSPAYNGRLLQEHAALTALHTGGFAPPGSYPEPLFAQEHHGLALIGQAVLPGSSFRNVTTARPDCPYAREAVEWLTRLGESSIERHIDTATIARDLDEMVARFAEHYPATDSERAFLSDCVAALRSSGLQVPLVFQHGDATTWNVVTREGGGVAFLDWEHGARHGPPLWDLLDFVQSFGRWVMRFRDVGSSPNALVATFLEPSALNTLTARAVNDYCERVGVSRELVAPLFYTCWVQRAMRSVASGSVPRATSPFFHMLRVCIAGRDKPGLKCIIS